MEGTLIWLWIRIFLFEKAIWGMGIKKGVTPDSNLC